MILGDKISDVSILSEKYCLSCRLLKYYHRLRLKQPLPQLPCSLRLSGMEEAACEGALDERHGAADVSLAQSSACAAGAGEPKNPSRDPHGSTRPMLPAWLLAEIWASLLCSTSKPFLKPPNQQRGQGGTHRHGCFAVRWKCILHSEHRVPTVKLFRST